MPGTGRLKARPLLLLLVEDSEADVVLTTEAFEDAQILVDIMVATDGARALELLQEAARTTVRLPELILLDLNLPKVDGLTVLETIKADPVLKVIPVIVMTSSRSPQDLRNAYERHANSLIAKPVTPTDFVSTVQAIHDYWLSVVRLPGR